MHSTFEIYTEKCANSILKCAVARVLFAERLLPFVNVYFHTALDSKSVNTPDVDVMGCKFLADATIFFAHYDCKSGDSEVISRILKLLGLRNRIPPKPGFESCE